MEFEEIDKTTDTSVDRLIGDGLTKGGFMTRVSKKYSFGLVGIAAIVLVVPIAMKLGVPVEALPWAIAASDASILILTVSYLTGQAKIDLSAIYGTGNKEQK